MSIYRAGDIVRIVQYSNEYGDWGGDNMNETIGRTGLVIYLSDNRYPTITTWDEDGDSCMYYYEDASLELETDPERLEFIRLKLAEGYSDPRYNP